MIFFIFDAPPDCYFKRDLAGQAAWFTQIRNVSVKKAPNHILVFNDFFRFELFECVAARNPRRNIRNAQSFFMSAAWL